MKTVTQFPNGVSALSQSLYNATPIWAVQIDNPTGSWLRLKSESSWCPPLTLGWTVTLSYGQSSVDLVAGDGPAGQQSSALGATTWQLTLSDAPMPDSSGSPYQLTTGTAPSQGAVRFLGKLSALPGGTASQAFTIQPTERSMIFIADMGVADNGTAWNQGVTSGITSPVGYLGTGPAGVLNLPYSAFVNSSVDTAWIANFTNNNGLVTHNCWVFASTEEISVAMNGGLLTGVVLTDFVSGQHPAATSLPVVLASNKLVPTAGGAPASANNALHAPVATTLATVTIAAVASQRVVVDEAVFKLKGSGVVDSQTATMSSVGVGSRSRRLSVVATNGDKDEAAFHGYVGASGQSVVCAFGAVPAAGNYESVDVSYHYVDANGIPV